MSKKDGVRVEETKVSTTGDPVVHGVLGAVLLFVLGGWAIKKGVEIGESVSDEILRHRDKDIRRQERKEQRERKELLREERRAEKERLKRERKKFQW